MQPSPILKSLVFGLFLFLSPKIFAANNCSELFSSSNKRAATQSIPNEFIKDGLALEWHNLDETVIISVLHGQKSQEGKTEFSLFFSDRFYAKKNGFKGGALPTALNFKFDKVISKRIVRDSEKTVFSNSEYELETVSFFSSIERLVLRKKGWLFSEEILRLDGGHYTGITNRLFVRPAIKFDQRPLNGKDAKDLFDFLVQEAGAPSLEFEHNYRGLLVIEDINNPGRFTVDFTNIKHRAQLLDVQQGLKELGLNLSHPIFLR